MRKNDFIIYKKSKEETIKYLKNALIVYPGLRAMIEERNVKVERMARAKYALFEHDKLEEMEQYENVDEYVLSEMKKDFEIDDDTFHKNCPNRYEIYQCVCGKWTIDFFYEY